MDRSLARVKPQPTSKGVISSEDRRDCILDAARECFMSEGYGATSMSAIAARLGGSKGTLYNYFPSKEQLFEAFIRRECGRFAQRFYEVPEATDTRSRLVSVAECFLQLLLSRESMAIHRLVVGEGERFPELGRIFYAAGPKMVIGRLTDEIAGMMQAGVLRSAPPALAAHQFKDLSISGLYQTRLWGVIPDPTPEQITAQAQTAVDTFLRAYRPE